MVAKRWIRLDVSWEDSPWLDALDGAAAGCWPRLLCLVKRDGLRGRCKRPDPGVIARRWRVTRDAVTALEDAAVQDGALTIENGEWVVTAWSTYQEPDATAAVRQRRHRADKSRLSPLRRDTVTTPSRRDTVTDRESRRDPSRATETSTDVTDSARTARRKRWRVVPADWTGPNDQHRALAAERGVDLRLEELKFRNFEFERPKSDADRTFTNWILNARPSQPAELPKPAPRYHRTAAEVLAMFPDEDVA
jgi:hypothetical protein